MVATTDLEAEAKRLTHVLKGSWLGAGGSARCPAHDDGKPSLSISAGRTTVLLHCFAGCEFIDIIHAIRARGALNGVTLPTGTVACDLTSKDYAPLARKIWSEARPLIGSLAERYLVGRGLVPP